MLLNTGDGSFRRSHDYPAGTVELSVAVGDLNGDGKPDLAIANDDGGYEFEDSTLSVLLNRGAGIFRETEVYYRAGPEGDANSIAAGDLNGDGRQDLVTANFSSNTVSVFINTPGLCTVQDVSGTLAAAKRALARAGCRVTVRRAYSTPETSWAEKGEVIASEQTPRFGAVLPSSGRVSLVVSRGHRRS